MYETIKIIHLTSISISISGFLLRAALAFKGSCWLQKRWIRTPPHIVDSILLASGI